MRRTTMVTTMLLSALALAPALAGVAAASPHGPRTPYVVGGADAASDLWPSMAALVAARVPLAYDGQFCAGTVIAPNAVLTAAHCVARKADDPGAVHVVVGRRDLTSDEGQRVAVSAIVPHPQATFEPVVRYDAAVLILAQPVLAPPIRLATAADAAALVVPGSSASVAGWGAVSRDEHTFPAVLQTASVPLLDDATCAIRLAPIPFDGEATICAGWDAGDADVCVGDSGGPLVRTDATGAWVQLGIVSWGRAGGCGMPWVPSAYTDVAAISAWALQVVASTAPPPPADDVVVVPAAPSAPATVEPAVARVVNRPPIVRALAATGRRDQVLRLRYRVEDDGGWTRQSVRIYATGGVLKARLTTLWRSVRPGRTASVEWRVPPRFRRGVGTFCVEARDQAGATGGACAQVRVR